jgi:regulator of protease activity HflC (stomatin/prohibitin superfamily)
MFIRTILVHQHEQALLYKNGCYIKTVGPGFHRLWGFHRAALKFDLRKRSFALAGQEIMTKDHVPIRITLSVTSQIVDPVAAAHEVEDWFQQVYTDVQLTLREIVAGLSFDELLDQKSTIGEQVLEVTSAKTAAYGVQLHETAIKDVTMPASIRDMMLKTVEAEKSGQASLIKAREEVAAARARANAAKMISENPAVLRLKELETLTELARSPGSTIVFTGAADPQSLIATNGKK